MPIRAGGRRAREQWPYEGGRAIWRPVIRRGVELEWSNRAACLSAEPEQFFPVGAADSATWEAAAAKRVCAGCDVLVECRDYALETRQPFGVWGGMDEIERRALLAGEVVSAAR